MTISSIDSGATGAATVNINVLPQFAAAGNGAAQSQPATGAAQPQSVAPSTGNSPEVKSAQPSRSEVESAVQKVQKFIQTSATAVQFSIDQKSGTTVVKVVDSENHNVIRQIPSQEMLDIAQALDKLQGLLVKDKA